MLPQSLIQANQYAMFPNFWDVTFDVAQDKQIELEQQEIFLARIAITHEVITKEQWCKSQGINCGMQPVYKMQSNVNFLPVVLSSILYVWLIIVYFGIMGV